jgi:hypothetical protein
MKIARVTAAVAMSMIKNLRKVIPDAATVA